MESKTEIKIVDALKKCINQEIKNIYVTGFSEIKDNYNLFIPMNWWYYLEFENYFLCISSDTTEGMLQLYTHLEIQCNFELHEGDVFTVAPIDNKTYLGQEIIGYDLIYGNFHPELFALGIQFKDNKYLHKDNKYVFFDSMTLDGIEVGDKKDKNNLLKDKRFYMKKFPEENQVLKEE